MIDGVVVIAGDLFEKEEDLKDDKIWKDAGDDSFRKYCDHYNDPRR